jgi:hypothetical protein
MKSESVEFPATIPSLETAIKIHGEGGARVQLDVAEADLGKFLPALVMRGKRLLVRFRESGDA